MISFANFVHHSILFVGHPAIWNSLFQVYFNDFNHPLNIFSILNVGFNTFYD